MINQTANKTNINLLPIYPIYQILSVLINLYELNFPMLVYLKIKKIMAQWNKICKYKVKITRIYDFD